MPTAMYSNLTAWKEERKTGMRCKAFVKNGEGHQCTIRALVGSDFCGTHLRTEREKQPIEAVRLENTTGQAHVVVAEALNKHGMSVVNQNGGWPDLLIKNGNRLFAVEVKRGADTLKNNQRRVLDALRGTLPCFVLRLDAPCGDGEITWHQLL